MPKLKQISFDIDTNVVKEILGEKKYTNIYDNVRKFMKSKGWEHIEDSVYMSKYPQTNSDIAFLIDELKMKYPYITKCVKRMHQADVSNVHEINFYFEYDGTPGKFAQKEQRQERDSNKESYSQRLKEGKAKAAEHNKTISQHKVKEYEQER